MELTGIILAGGKSNRMGTTKALLEVGGITLIERVARVLSKVCSEIIIAGGQPDELGHLGYPMVPDLYSGCGPLSGIHAGLTAAGNRYSFISACDTPFLNEKLIRLIASRADGYDAVILKTGQFFEPLCSLYSKGFIPAAETSIKNGVYKVTAALELVKWTAVTVDSTEVTDLRKSLFNINTPRDYKEAQKLTKNEKGNF